MAIIALAAAATRRFAFMVEDKDLLFGERNKLTAKISAIFEIICEAWSILGTQYHGLGLL